jgi:enoyl-CoA hydratase/carnithine racemase
MLKSDPRDTGTDGYDAGEDNLKMPARIKMTYQFITVECADRITIVTLNRPEVHNALNAAAHRELQSAFDDFENDRDQWVAIVTGAGDKAFCAGHDLKQQASGGGLDVPDKGFAGLTSRFSLTKPVIAAVNGVAMGGGFEIALACDLIIAAPHAKFALPEPKVGIAALAGGLQRLPRSIGLNRAMGILLTGRAVLAAEGLALGFVNEIATDCALDCAKRWAGQIVEGCPLSIRATKRAVLESYSGSIEDDHRAMWELDEMKALLSSEDYREGPIAFVERRKPIWKNA